MDISGFKIVEQNGHYELYQYGVFKCSGDNKQEIEEELNTILIKCIR